MHKRKCFGDFPVGQDGSRSRPSSLERNAVSLQAEIIKACFYFCEDLLYFPVYIVNFIYSLFKVDIMNVSCFPLQLLVWLGRLPLFQGVLMPRVWYGSWTCNIGNDCTLLSLWHFIDLPLNSVCRWWRYFRNGPPPRSSHFRHGRGEKKK